MNWEQRGYDKESVRPEKVMFYGTDITEVLENAARDITEEMNRDVFSAPVTNNKGYEAFYEDIDVLEEALATVSGPRADAYGHPADTLGPTGKMWAAILGVKEIDPSTVALMLMCLKIARERNKPKRDNLVDIAGYAWCAEKCLEREG